MWALRLRIIVPIRPMNRGGLSFDELNTEEHINDKVMTRILSTIRTASGACVVMQLEDHSKENQSEGRLHRAPNKE